MIGPAAACLWFYTSTRNQANQTHPLAPTACTNLPLGENLPALLPVVHANEPRPANGRSMDLDDNGSVHNSNVSRDLPVQGQAIQKILPAAPSRDHPVHVLPPTFPFIAPLAFTTSTRHTPVISLGECGSEALTSSLPPSISSLIATDYLLGVATYAYHPHGWDARDVWPSRVVFTLIRDAMQLEKLIQICPPWFTARTSLLSCLPLGLCCSRLGVAMAAVDLCFDPLFDHPARS